MSNKYMPIDSPYAISYLMAGVSFALYLTISGPRSNQYMLIDSPYAISHLMAGVPFALYLTISEKFAVAMSMILTLTFKTSQGQI